MKKLRHFLRRLWMLFFGERERNDYVMQYAKFAWALIFGRGSFIKQSWGETPNPQETPDICIFVHYDKHGLVHDYVLLYLQALRDAGRGIVFVTNSPKFPQIERQKLDGLCAKIQWRNNKGYDFGAYADGLKSLGNFENYHSITLCNDSVYGPLSDLSAVYDKMDPSAADIWGMTDSWDQQHHLQSYFLVFHKAALEHLAFQKRWKNYIHVPSKSWVIRKHEIGITGELRKAGLRAKAAFPYRVLLGDFFDRMGDASVLNDKDILPKHRKFLSRIYEHAEHGLPLNVTHFFWDRLIIEFDFPFIKREILQSNPSALPGVYRWEKFINTLSDYDTSAITRHLEFTQHGRFM